MVQMVDLLTKQSSMERQTFHCDEPTTRQTFVDMIQRERHHEDFQLDVQLLDRRSFCITLVSCKDGAKDEFLEQLAVIRFYPMKGDMDFRGWRKGLRVHLCFLY